MCDLIETLDFVVETAREAGRLVKSTMGWFSVSRKTNNEDRLDVVTDADFASERLIVERLRGCFPDYDVFTEETAHTIASEWFWAVDPIDGTKNFVSGLPYVSISIGLLRGGVPQLGVIHSVFSEETFAARRGGGAKCNGTPIRVSDTARLEDSMVVLEGVQIHLRERRYVRKLHLGTRSVRNLGSAALNIAYMARGSLDGYIDEDLKYHDFAAGAVILEEAGGRLTHCDGSAMWPRMPDYGDIDVLASNGHIHDALVEVVSEG
ncbi:MAG: inositol monophosphatase [Verrucomicrobia bacterium]|nr:inositol monophosphatase [Verrucomicrobiota bacterium]